MKRATKLQERIDQAYQHEEDILRGGHLSASQLGTSCSRRLWYAFRWAGGKPGFSPRILRLFGRGNREEDVFAQLMEEAGVTFWSRDPATNDQFKIAFRNPHISGYCDGIGEGLPDLPTKERFVAEWKTHNHKSFSELERKGVQEAKPEHYTQMQLYMHQLNIQWGLYGAVNKNDDHLHLEIVAYDKDHAEQILTRASWITYAVTPPVRISDNPGWYECKWCDFYQVCHAGRKMDDTCRSCAHVQPLPNGDWWCGLHDIDLNLYEQRAGCPDHVRMEE